MSEELKPTGSIGDYAAFCALLDNYADSAYGQGAGMRGADASADQRRTALVDYIDKWAARRASRPEAESEMPAKPYAYEYGESNGDGTYSVVINRGDMVQVGERKYEYGPPKRAVKDWPVKPLYTRPVAGNAARDDARDALDAQRYRWLRDPKNAHAVAIVDMYSAAPLDDRIDAAIKASKQGGKS